MSVVAEPKDSSRRDICSTKLETYFLEICYRDAIAFFELSQLIAFPSQKGCLERNVTEVRRWGDKGVGRQEVNTYIKLWEFFITSPSNHPIIDGIYQKPPLSRRVGEADGNKGSKGRREQLRKNSFLFFLFVNVFVMKLQHQLLVFQVMVVLELHQYGD